LPPSFFFSSRRRHTRSKRDWSSDVCSSDLNALAVISRKNMYYSEQPDEFPYMADTVVPEEALDDMRTIADDPQLSKHVLSTYGRSEERRVGKECRYRRWKDH